MTTQTIDVPFCSKQAQEFKELLLKVEIYKTFFQFPIKPLSQIKTTPTLTRNVSLTILDNK